MKSEYVLLGVAAALVLKLHWSSIVKALDALEFPRLVVRALGR